MISAQTPSAFVARENRFTLCANAALRVRIMRARYDDFGIFGMLSTKPL